MAIERDDVFRILKLLDESDFDELHLEMGELKLDVVKSGAGCLPAVKEPATPPAAEPKRSEAPPAAAAAPAVPSAPAKSAPAAGPSVPAPAADGLVPIRSDLLGTFYRSPKPGAPPFVEVGSKVTKEDTVCLIEVMKTFTSIKSGVDGRIARICAENAEMVEYGQILYLVEPEPGA